MAPRLLRAVLLVVIMAAQVALTSRLMTSVGSDHSDEAIYIYGGHQLIHEMLHGGGSPYYENWYSGAPVIYPVLAAVADHFGGLVLARTMSAAVMIGATALLYLTAARIFGYWVGVAAAGLFVGLGVTQSLGALATFDAMSLTLMSLAAYCATRARDSVRWLLAVPIVLLVANATAYVTVLFDPIVVGLAALQLRPDGWRRVGQRALALGSAALVLTGVCTFLAGSAYIKGIMFTTLARKSGAQVIFGAHSASAREVISLSWGWVGVVTALGSLALLVAVSRPSERRSYVPLLALLVAAGALVTIGNIRLHTDQSMSKHDDIGAWFACVPAGYAVARAAELMKRWYAKLPAVLIAAAAVTWSGVYYSQPAKVDAFSFSMPLSRADGTYSFLAPYLRSGTSKYLLGSMDAYEMLYDNHSSAAWYQFFDDSYIKYPIPGRGGDSHGQAPGLACGDVGQPPITAPGCMYLEGEPGYRAAIRAHWFSLITLVHNHRSGLDAVILAAVRSTPGYVLLTRQDGAPTYIYGPDYGLRALQPRPHHDHPAPAPSQPGATARKLMPFMRSYP